MKSGGGDRDSPRGVKSLRSIAHDARACPNFSACKLKQGGPPDGDIHGRSSQTRRVSVRRRASKPDRCARRQDGLAGRIHPTRIEGTQATLTDLFDEEAGFKVSNTDDVEEVTNYLQAFRWVQEQLRGPERLPISVRLLCQAHRLLLDGARGAGKQPGELRRSQNWIGGTRPGNAAFVPPPPEHVPALLADMERFIHDDGTELPPMVRVALIHAHFETIHPFLDGNGRIGRLLIAALFEHWGLLAEPLMYLSGYLKQHQAEYYRRLSAIRTEGDWGTWVTFFLEGVAVAAADAERNIIEVASLVAADRKRLLQSPKAGPASYRLFEMLPMMPRFTIERVRQQLDTSFPTATAAVKVLEDLGIVAEMTGQKKTEVTATRPTSNCSLGDKYAPSRSLPHRQSWARRVGVLLGNRPPPFTRARIVSGLGDQLTVPART